jgi:hypothetical protein
MYFSSCTFSILDIFCAQSRQRPAWVETRTSVFQNPLRASEVQVSRGGDLWRVDEGRSLPRNGCMLAGLHVRNILVIVTKIARVQTPQRHLPPYALA